MLTTLANTPVLNTTTTISTINTMVNTLVKTLPDSTPTTGYEVTIFTNTLNENVIGVNFDTERVKDQLLQLNNKPKLLKQDVCLIRNIVDYILDDIDSTYAVIGSLSDIKDNITYFDGFRMPNRFVKASLTTPNTYIDYVDERNLARTPDGYTLKRNGTDTFIGFITMDNGATYVGLFEDLNNGTYTRTLEAIAGELHQYQLISSSYYGYKDLIEFISLYMNTKPFEHRNEAFSREAREHAKLLKNVIKYITFGDVNETETTMFLRDVYDQRAGLNVDEYYKYPPSFRALCDIYGLTVFKEETNDTTLGDIMESNQEPETISETTSETTSETVNDIDYIDVIEEAIVEHKDTIEEPEVVEDYKNMINPLEPKGLDAHTLSKDMYLQPIFKYQHDGNVANYNTIMSYGNNLLKSFKHTEINERYKAGIIIGTHRAILLADRDSMINYINNKEPKQVEQYLEVIQKTLFDTGVYIADGSMRNVTDDDVYSGLDDVFVERILSIEYITNLLSNVYYATFRNEPPKFKGDFEIHLQPKQETTPKPKQTVVKRVEKEEEQTDVDKLVELMQIKDNQIDEALQGLVYRDTQIDKLIETLNKRDAQIEKLLDAVENRDEKLDIVTNTLESFQNTLEDVIKTVSNIADANIEREDSFTESIKAVGDKLDGINHQRFNKQNETLEDILARTEDNTLALVDLYEKIDGTPTDPDPDKQPKPESEQEEIINDIKDIVEEASHDTQSDTTGFGLGLGLDKPSDVRVINPLTEQVTKEDESPTVLEVQIRNAIEDKPLFDKLKIIHKMLSDNGIGIINLPQHMKKNEILSSNFETNIGVSLDLVLDVLGKDNPTDEDIQEIVEDAIAEEQDDEEIMEKPEFESKINSVFMTAMEDIATEEEEEVRFTEDEINTLVENADFYKANEAEAGTFYLGITPIEFSIRKFNLLPQEVKEKIHAEHAIRRLKANSDWDESEDDLIEEDESTLRESTLKEYPSMLSIDGYSLADEIIDTVTEEDIKTILKGKTSLYLRNLSNVSEAEYGHKMIEEVYNKLVGKLDDDIVYIEEDNLNELIRILSNDLETPVYTLYQYIDNKDVMTPEMLYVHVMMITEAITLVANGIQQFTSEIKTSIAVNNRVLQSDTEVVFDGKPRMATYNALSVYGLTKEQIKVDPSLGFGKPNFIGESIKSIELNQLALLSEVACLHDHQTCGELADNFANMLIGNPSSITAPNKLAKKIKELADKGTYTDNHFGIYAIKPENNMLNSQNTIEVLKIKQAFKSIGVNILPSQINVLIKQVGYNLLQTELYEIKSYLDYTLLSMMFARYAYYCYKANIDYTCFTNVNALNDVITQHNQRPETNSVIATLYVATKTMYLLQEFLLNTDAKGDPCIMYDESNKIQDYIVYKDLIGVSSKALCGGSTNNNNTPRLIPVQCNELLSMPYIIDVDKYNNALLGQDILREVAIINVCTVEEASEFIQNAYGLRDGHGNIVERIISRKLTNLPIEQQQHMKYIFLSEILSTIVIPQQGQIRGSVAMTLETMYTKDTADILDLARGTNMSKCGTITVSDKQLTHNLISDTQQPNSEKLLRAKSLIVSAGKALEFFNKISADVLHLDISTYETVDDLLQKDSL